jgi:CheY-like chemotaxis protein
MATILCVDDTRADLSLMAISLKEAGHTVLRAEHVPAALELLECEKPDLIVSDYRPPKVSGRERTEYRVDGRQSC